MGTWNSWEAWRCFWGFMIKSMEGWRGHSHGADRAASKLEDTPPSKGIGGVDCWPQGREGVASCSGEAEVRLDITPTSHVHLLWRNHHISKNCHHGSGLTWGLGFCTTCRQPVRQFYDFFHFPSSTGVGRIRGRTCPGAELPKCWSGRRVASAD